MESLLRASLDSFEKRGVTEEDILRFKGTNESGFIYALQSVQGKVNQLASFQTLTGDPKLMTQELRMYNAVTREDVMRVYNQYIKNSHAVILSVLTKGQDSLIAKTDNYRIDTSNYKAPDYGYASLKYTKPKDNFDRRKMPGNGPNPVVKVPAFWRKDLTNGIRMIGVENNEIPVINLAITIPGGHLLQAGDTSKIGLARLFAGMMNEDTKNRTAEQMYTELQKLGSSIYVTSETDHISFSVQTLKKNLDKTLDLLQERMFQPSFSDKTFSRRQRQMLEGRKQSKSRPAAIASEVIARINYGPENILGMSLEGTESTIKNITLKDIENYYQNYISSQGAKVVIVGDIKESEMLSKLEFLNKLPNRKIQLPAVDTKPLNSNPSKIYLVDVPRAAQTEFRVGYLTGMKYDATGDYYKAGLMNFSLGGGFNSRLNLNLREDKGWTYGARSAFESSKYGGAFEFSSGIKAEATDSALFEVIKEIKNFAVSGITDTELAFMKSATGQRDALRYETGQQKAGFISRILEYDLPPDYVELQNKILKDITLAEINTLSKKWIQPDKLNMLMVGDKVRILPGLKKLGYPIEELDTDGTPVEKRAF
jgi:zinc protease